MRQVVWVHCPRGWAWQLPAVKPRTVAVDSLWSPGRSVCSQVALPQWAVYICSAGWRLLTAQERWDVHRCRIKWQGARGQKCIPFWVCLISIFLRLCPWGRHIPAPNHHSLIFFLTLAGWASCLEPLAGNSIQLELIMLFIFSLVMFMTAFYLWQIAPF